MRCLTSRDVLIVDKIKFVRGEDIKMENVLKKEEIIEVVSKSKKPKEVKAIVDEYTKLASECFDYEFEGVSKFYPFEKPKNIPEEFSIGLIVGASGTGKTTLLKEFGEEETISWSNEKSIVSHFESPQDGINRLSAVGLNSVPSWVRPYNVLSNGEKFRADLSRRIKDNAVIDEFTSVVDRNVAKATSTAISKYINKNNIKNVVFSTCHYDIIEWLEPDWVFDANTGTLYNGRYLRRPTITLEVFSIEKDIWGMFSHHHYLDNKLNKSARCYGVLWDKELIGFSSVIAMPSGTIKNAWREHRTVILPDFQGMGLGTRVSSVIAELYRKQGLKFYSRTAHPRLKSHREKSNLWKTTSTNGKKRTNVNEGNASKSNKSYTYDENRVCSSFEYVGKDYYEKEHFNLIVTFSERYQDKIGYKQFEDSFSNFIKNIKKEKYLTIISGKQKEENFAEMFSKEYGIRNEILPINKIYDKTKPLKKICNGVLVVGEDIEIEERCLSENIPCRKIELQ